jgi:hypothetical protein
MWSVGDVGDAYFLLILKDTSETELIVLSCFFDPIGCNNATLYIPF